MSDDDTYADIAVAGLKDACSTANAANIPPAANASEPLPQNVTNLNNLMCPKDCSNNGHCDAGTCKCNVNFIGDDCSININDPPTLSGVDNDGACPTNDCKTYTVYGEDFFENGMQCHLQEITIENNGVIKKIGNIQTIPAIYSSVVDVTCDLSGKDVTAKYQVQVSNNGFALSQEKVYFLPHNECFVCGTENNLPMCNRTDNGCFINEKCYREGTRNSQDKCKICKPQTNRNDWTADCPDVTNQPGAVSVTKDDSLSNVEIGLIVLAVIVALTVIGLTVYLIYDNKAKKGVSSSEGSLISEKYRIGPTATRQSRAFESMQNNPALNVNDPSTYQ